MWFLGIGKISSRYHFVLAHLCDMALYLHFSFLVMDLIRAFSSTAIGFGHYIFLHSVSFMYLFLFYFYWVVQSSLKIFLNFYVLVIPLRCCILITTILNKCRHPILYFSFDLGIKNSLFYMIGPFQLCF